jgi:hypothetical protein
MDGWLSDRGVAVSGSESEKRRLIGRGALSVSGVWKDEGDGPRTVVK